MKTRLRTCPVTCRGLLTLSLLLSSAALAGAQDAPVPTGGGVSKMAASPLAVSEPKYHAFALRLGANLSPQTGPAFGLDYTPRGMHLAPGFSTRFDFEAAFNTRGNNNSLQGEIDPVSSVTINQVYANPRSRERVYVGAGIGAYTGPTGSPIFGTGLQLFGPSFKDETRFGGKVFVGANFTSTTGAEAAVHFAGSTTLVTVQLRLKL